MAGIDPGQLARINQASASHRPELSRYPLVMSELYRAHRRSRMGQKAYWLFGVDNCGGEGGVIDRWFWVAKRSFRFYTVIS